MKYLRPKEVAAIMGCRPDTVRKLCTRGELGFRFGGRWMIRSDELEAIASGERDLERDDPEPAPQPQPKPKPKPEPVREREPEPEPEPEEPEPRSGGMRCPSCRAGLRIERRAGLLVCAGCGADLESSREVAFRAARSNPPREGTER